MSKVYVDTRNSNAEAFEKGSSRTTQIKKCTNYASIKDLTIDEIVEEQCSGTIPFERREKAFELLNKLKSNDHIICSHLDRFCRNTLSLLQMIQKFKKKKIYLHFVDLNCETTGSDAIGNVFLTMLSCLDRKSTRLNSSHIQKSRMPSSA